MSPTKQLKRAARATRTWTQTRTEADRVAARDAIMVIADGLRHDDEACDDDDDDLCTAAEAQDYAAHFVAAMVAMLDGSADPAVWNRVQRTIVTDVLGGEAQAG